jgi:hypothetical protein
MQFISRCLIDGIVFQPEALDGAGEDATKTATENPTANPRNEDEENPSEAATTTMIMRCEGVGVCHVLLDTNFL